MKTSSNSFLPLALCAALAAPWAMAQEPKSSSSSASSSSSSSSDDGAVRAVATVKSVQTKRLADGEETIRLAQVEDEVLVSEPLTVDLVAKGSGHDRTLVINAGALDENGTDSLQEDMAIMARILSKAIQEKRSSEDNRILTAMGIVIDAKSYIGNRFLRHLYISDYGVIFLFHVPFPLLPPAEKAEDEKSRSGNDTWERTKLELFGRQQGRGSSLSFFSRSGEAYDEQKVERVKTQVMEALRNASNIRALKPEEYVTVCLIAPHSAKGSKKSVRLERQESDGGVFAFVQPEATHSGETVLTIRAKKGDIDALAKGELTLAQFKERVTFHTN